jgi:hypothetical protein
MSLDQIQQIAADHQKEIIDPLAKIGGLMEAGLQFILGELGVDCACDDDQLHEQMTNLGIFIQERDEVGTPKANGFYVFQGMTAETIQPVAFVSAPFVNNLGKANVIIELYRDDIQMEIGGIKIPVF